MGFIFIIFIGHHKDRLMNSIKYWMKFYPPEKFILITGQEKTTGERRANKIAEEMKEDLKTPLYPALIEQINKIDISEAINQLQDIINREKDKGYDILLDISGSLRIFSVIAYIAACLTKSKLVSVIPMYNIEDDEIGIENFLEIPILPQYPLGEEQSKIIKSIGPGVDSIERLVHKINPESKNNEKIYNSERSRISYYLDSLEKGRFITREKQGKNVKINLTDLGRIFSIYPSLKGD